MANFTQTMSPSATDSKVSSQSENILASVSPTLSSALSLATRTSTVAELTSHGDFVSSSFSTYFGQDPSWSMSESFTFFPWVRRLDESRILPFATPNISIAQFRYILTRETGVQFYPSKRGSGEQIHRNSLTRSSRREYFNSNSIIL